MYLEEYFDRGIIFTRFTTFEDLKNKINENIDVYNLKVKSYDFKSDYDNDFQDFELTMAIYENENLEFDLTIYYAITRIGERIIVESNFERY